MNRVASWLAGFVALAGPLVLQATPARAADEAQLVRELEAFDHMTLWHDNKVPVATRKFAGKVRWRFAGIDPGGWREVVVASFARMAALSGLDVAAAAEGEEENFTVKFEETSAYFIGGRAAGCYATTRFNSATGAIVRAELFVNLSQRQAMRRCIVHEMVHGFGFPGHPHDLDSILSYTWNRDDLTALDESAFRTLYDRRVGANWYHLPALIAARQVLAERLGLVAAGAKTDHLARAYLDGAVVWLKRAGDGGDLFAQAQLGNAYWFGQHVAVDGAEALRWWTRAADSGHADSAFRLGWAADRGEKGAAKSDEAALRWYGLAAKQGHAAAINNLGSLIENGRGAPADPVEAWAHYRVAADRGNETAKRNVERVGAKLTQEQAARAAERAKAIAGGG
jgi:TPR repeat protein